MNAKSLLFAGAAVAALTFGAIAHAQDAPADGAVPTAAPEQVRGPVDPRDAKIVQLEMQLQELAEQVADLKASVSSGFHDVRDTAAAADRVTIANGKPSIASADGKFTANLHGIVHFDTAEYFQGTVPAAQTDAHARDLNSGTNFRRARLAIDGKAFGDFNYGLVTEFGGAGNEDPGRLYEAWVEYAGFKPFRFRVGAFAPSNGLEDANSTNGMPFIERPTPSEISRQLAAGDSRVAAQLAANGDNWLAAVAVTGNTLSNLSSSGTSFLSQNFDEQLGYTGRLTYVPISNSDLLLHVGVNASIVSQPGDAGPAAAVRYGVQLRDRPELRVDSTRLIDTGALDANGAYNYGLELAAQHQNFYAQAEYFAEHISRRTIGVASPNFHGWYVEGSWILTGETRKYNTGTAAFDAPPVAHPFARDGGWGAWELAVRYSDQDLNFREGAAGTAATPSTIRGGEQKIWTVGANWYLNSMIRLMLDVQHVDVERLNSAGAQIGQSYEALALRTQLAF